MLIKYKTNKQNQPGNCLDACHSQMLCGFDQEVKAEHDKNRHYSRIQHRKPLHRDLKVLLIFNRCGISFFYNNYICGY